MNIVLLYKKGCFRLRKEKNRLWKYLNVESISMYGFHDFADNVSFKSRLSLLLGLFDSSLLCGISKKDQEIIVSSAENALLHEFNLLGSGPVLINPVDWHVDFINGKHWEKNFYLDLTTPTGADIKVPWELSRCQHFLWLGEAYLITGEDKYAKEIVDEINWWIDDNPMMYSVNWKCAMDVAFRAVTWMYALNMISEYKGFNDIFSAKVSRSLWQHGVFIYNNLEKTYPTSANHYASNLVGLVYLGELFSHTNKGQRWLRYGKRELFSEIRSQLLPSGIHFERSISYHRLMTEILSYPMYMLQRLGEDIPCGILGQINNMYSFVATYTKPNGFAPLVGDNDNGRFLPFQQRDFRAHNYLNAPNSIENRIVSVGLKPLFCQSGKNHMICRDANIVVLKKCDCYLFVSGGGFSRNTDHSMIINGNHTHNDALSFEFSAGGKDLIIDPGTYIYTSDKEKRNEFRSTLKHNTVIIDNEEQNALPESASFTVYRNIQVEPLERKDGLIIGSYETLRGGMRHSRSFSLDNNKLVITDNIEKRGIHKAELFFHLAESIEFGKDVCFYFEKGECSILNDYVSPSYGTLVPASTIKNVISFSDFLTHKTTITWKS